MTEIPRRQKADVDRDVAGGPQLRRELAQAAASLELSDLDTSDAHVGELLEITFAHGRDRGRPYSVGELHAMAAGELPDFPSAPGPEALKVLRRVAAKCSLRSRYGLAHHPCAEEQGGCECLDTALEPGARRGRGGSVKRRLLSLARRAHISPPVYPSPPTPTPRPQERRAESQEATERVEDLFPTPEPAPKAESRVRVVSRTRKWFDDVERPRFCDMKF